MRAWLAWSLIASGTAAAEPGDAVEQPACATCEPITFGGRLGVAGSHLRLTNYRSPGGTSPVLELELGQWITHDASLSLIGSYSALDTTGEQGEPWNIGLLHLGARFAYHVRDTPFVVGYGFGIVVTRASNPPMPVPDTNHYVEGVLGIDVGQLGPVELELLGNATLGADLSSLGATVGAIWDPPRAVPCARSLAGPQVVGALRVGTGYTDVSFPDADVAGSAGWYEGELGVEVTPWLALVAALSRTTVSGHLSDFSGNPIPVTYHDTRAGARAQLWPISRAFVAAGFGALVGGNDQYNSGLFLELELGIVIARWQHLALEVASQGSFSGGIDTGTVESSYSLGVAWR